MKTKLLLLTCILVLTTGVISDVQAQTATTPQAPEWKTYTVKGAGFSVSVPILPAVHSQTRYPERTNKPRRELLLGSYADGVAYTVYVLDNSGLNQPLQDFIAEHTGGNSKWAGKTESSVSRDGLSGKVFVDPADGMVQFFAGADRLYRFMAFGAPADDARLTKFFSSLSFAKTEGAVEVFDGPGLPYEQASQPAEAQDEKFYTGKEVTHRIRLAMKPEPQYTETAKENSITGTVVLKSVFAADGSVKNIKVVSGLPYGLTEKAIDAASKIKFVPAQKDGKWVSMWMQLEYNFNLF